MSRRPICRLYGTPAGCHKNKCRFSHIDPAATAPSAASQRGGPASSSGTTNDADVPKGVCRAYWKTGTCYKGFDCRYKHEQDPTKASTRSETGRTTSGVAIPEVLAPLLNAAALARLTEPGSDSLFVPSMKPRTPTEVHNQLKRFLYDDFHFKHVFDIYAFLGLLCDASSQNPSWNSEDGQLLLTTIAKGNGLSRINDILAWERVSINAGNEKQVLSFQRGYIPLLQYLSSDFVVKSIMSHLINALYMLLLEHFEKFTRTVQSCVKDMVARKTFRETSIPASKPFGGSQVFGPVLTVLYQCLSRLKNATGKYPHMRGLVHELKDWLESWILGISSDFSDPITESPPEVREQVCRHLSERASQLVEIVDREHNKIHQVKKPAPVRAGLSQEGILAALHNAYEGPGDSRTEGPRHDNDYVYISDIRIAPTNDELICRIPPFLPANIFGAPHPLPSESPEQLLDIQFRLLREEMTASLRMSVQQVLNDLQSTHRTQLTEILKRSGGKYKGQSDSQENVMFNLYTNVEFSQISADRRGISVSLSLDTPPGRARVANAGARASFWEGMGSKRLMTGGLVALIWKKGPKTDVHLGIISSSLRDHVASARQNESRISIKVTFFDPEVDLRILHESRYPANEREDVKLLVEATVMFASIRPFLEALRVEPTSVPFMKYLVHRPPDFLRTNPVDPPKYARLPNFQFDLTSLFEPAAGVQELRLNVANAGSISAARDLLREKSRLDPSQADAVIETLTREVALIQGPPGTGKSFTGVELLRVLIKNKAGPILMIAFTNHALDHLLCSVLDAKITEKMVRLGSRSADPRIQGFSIDAMEQAVGKSRLDRAFASNYRELKNVEEEINKLMKECLRTTVDTSDILSHLESADPLHWHSFFDIPPWVDLLYQLSKTNSDGGGEWTRVGTGGQDERIDDSPYAYWLSGSDLEFLVLAHQQPVRQPTPPPSQPSTSATLANQFEALQVEDTADDSSDSAMSVDDDELAQIDIDVLPEEAWMLINENPSPANPATDTVPPRVPTPGAAREAAPNPSARVEPSPALPVQPSDFYDVRDYFHHLGYDEVPPLLESDRSLETLADIDSIWEMSLPERRRIHDFWTAEVRTATQENRLQEFERLREKLETASKNFNEGKDEARCRLLKNVDIIGCTTTGAANLTALLKAIGPKIMLVEEAGQVLEAHILGSLVPSIQHLILIGDPLQLRPTLNNYSLSMDHRQGRLIYKFDMSLMERLSSSGFPMSQINVQRRMRPSISDLIRGHLYPQLEDHEHVKTYFAVQGLAKNVFFLSHNHKENGGGEDDSVSKYNSYEVAMIADLVMHLLRQGPYSSEGDIVVLCAYLGQLARMRDALSDKVAVVIDERDQIELADREAENDTPITASSTAVEHVKVAQRVRLRTIDNYQGEEAKIVILSLVRNSGGAKEDDIVHGHSSLGKVNVGFLKSENRTNVALSRAREGMFILGNAKDLSSRSEMWRSVVSNLEKDNAVGNAFPIICHQHRDDIQLVSKPGELPRIAPDGGCLRQCDARLNCGHLCPYKCHSDDPNHVAVTCNQRCTRVCNRGHPCSKSCAVDCGKCQTVVADVKLPCGHVTRGVPCASLDDLTKVVCEVKIRRQLTKCGHEAIMKCSDNPDEHRCSSRCGGIMDCCGRDCQAQCYRCQELTPEETTAAARTAHTNHPCQRRLYCEHLCGNACSVNHECTTECKEKCRQACVHARCRLGCSKPCAPCQEPCTWQCAHQTCPVPCGSICIRLPCDSRCQTVLTCGHRCPSVCGEDCSVQKCPLCASKEDRTAIVDLIMHRTLGDVDPGLEIVDDMLITIPNCGHVFTVETLDGHLHMTDYYEQDQSGRWVGLQAPPIGFLRPPTCPTCRGTITCPRYGRVFKRADLDILENNIASSMSRSLVQISSRLDAFPKANVSEKLKADGADSKLNIVAPTSVVTELLSKQNSALGESRTVPIQVTLLDPDQDLHGIPTPEANIWRSSARDLLKAYRDTCNIAGTRSSHKHAWEASYAYLYQQEMDAAIQDPMRAPRNPEDYAMRMAKLRIGQPPPRADLRFLVEAFWTSVSIRLTLVDLTRAWLSALSIRPQYPGENRKLWELYVFFLLRSCVRDLEIALEIAQESESRRQAIKTTFLLMRVELEQFEFNVDTLRRTGDNFTPTIRLGLADRAAKLLSDAQGNVSTTVRQYQFNIRNNGNRAAELQWLSDNFSDPSQILLQQWADLEEELRNDKPLSREEIRSIIRTLMKSDYTLSHTGHFYKCPNGHTYVIGECGGAMQEAHCPECGAAIGGRNHEVVAGNTRAMDLEEIMRDEGAAPSPFRWGPGI